MKQLPKHIAIVMDGNGRWATQRNLPRIAGHRQGAKAVSEVVKYCGEKGVDVLSLFAFSMENWQRPTVEVNFLMKLMLESLQRDTAELHENNVRLRIIGDRRRLKPSLLRQIETSEALTNQNNGLELVIALNYSGRWDIAQATQKLLQSCGQFDIDSLDNVESHLQQYLCLSDLPEPDLFIRTSGEQRISNFMLWQVAYSEIYFTDTYWPDFKKAEIEKALSFYEKRQRRFGLTPEQVETQYA